MAATHRSREQWLRRMAARKDQNDEYEAQARADEERWRARENARIAELTLLMQSDYWKEPRVWQEMCRLLLHQLAGEEIKHRVFVAQMAGRHYLSKAQQRYFFGLWHKYVGKLPDKPVPQLDS